MEWMKQQICFKTFSETFFLPAWMLKRTTCLTSQTSLSHISMCPSFEAGHKYTFLLLRGHLLITNNKSLGCEREHKHPEKTHASMRRACRLHTERPQAAAGFKPGPLCSRAIGLTAALRRCPNGVAIYSLAPQMSCVLMHHQEYYKSINV